MRRPWLREGLVRVHLEEVAGFIIVVLLAVHSPSVFRSGKLLAEVSARLQVCPVSKRDFDNEIMTACRIVPRSDRS